MLVERVHPSGARCISEVVGDSYYCQTYYGYTKREAIAEFKQYIIEEATA